MARGGKGLPQERGGDPLDLLDAGTSRKMVKHAAARGTVGPAAQEEEEDFERADDGKMIIRVLFSASLFLLELLFNSVFFFFTGSDCGQCKSILIHSTFDSCCFLPLMCRHNHSVVSRSAMLGCQKGLLHVANSNHVHAYACTHFHAALQCLQDEEAQGKKRRRNTNLDDSDDSDFDDIRHIHGAKAALRDGAGSVKYAATEGAKSRGRSTAGGSMGGCSLGPRTSATARGAGSQHSGDRSALLMLMSCLVG